MSLTLVSPLAFNRIRGRWLWFVECILAECGVKDARSNSMIRIETHQTESQLTFRITGKLCECVRAVEGCWNAAHLSSPALERAVDLAPAAAYSSRWRSTFCKRTGRSNGTR